MAKDKELSMAELFRLAKGDKGDRGLRGEDGLDGLDGKPGRDGKDGTNGTDGPQGEPGRDGKDGKDAIFDPSTLENLVKPLIIECAAENVGATEGIRGSSLVWSRAWDKTKTYSKGNIVYHWGSSYVALQEVPAGKYPGNRENAAFWDMMVKAGAGGGGSSSGSSSLIVEDEGVTVASDVTTLNFIGDAVEATDAGGGQVNVTITASAGNTIALEDEGVPLGDFNTMDFHGTGVTVVDDGGGHATVTVTATAYTDEQAQDAVGGILADTATINLTYNDGTPNITADVIDGSITFAKMQAITDGVLLGAQGGTVVEEISVGVTLGMSANTLNRAALTGDVTASAGSNATTIAPNAVTFAKMQAITDERLLGASGGTAVEEIAVGTGLAFSGNSIVSTITQYTDEMAQDAVGAMVDTTLVYVDATPLLTRAALTGDVTAAQGSNATTIANNAVTTVKVLDANITYAKIQNGTGLSVIGRSANSAGVNADIVGTDGQVLRVSGTALGFGTIVAAGIASDAVTTAKILDANVTFAKIQNADALSVVGRSANSSGVVDEIAAAADFNILRRSGTSIGFGVIDLTQAGAVGTSILTVPNGGTGRATLTDHGVLVGGGTGTVDALAVGTNGQLLLGVTSSDPVFATMSGYGTITNAGVLTVTKVQGTATNDNATAGDVGEYSETTVASPGTSLTSGAAANVGSISLTAGDWHVIGAAIFLKGATTNLTDLFAELTTSSTPAIGTPTTTKSNFLRGISWVTGTLNCAPQVCGRFSLSGTTSIYLHAQAIFTVSTCSVYGQIIARRAR